MDPAFDGGGAVHDLDLESVREVPTHPVQEPQTLHPPSTAMKVIFNFATEISGIIPGQEFVLQVEVSVLIPTQYVVATMPGNIGS